jgi:hypothetical protein
MTVGAQLELIAQLDVIGYVDAVINVVPPPFRAYEAVNVYDDDIEELAQLELKEEFEKNDTLEDNDELAQLALIL